MFLFQVDGSTYEVISYGDHLLPMEVWLLVFWFHNHKHEPIIRDKSTSDRRFSGPGHGGFDRLRAYAIYKDECIRQESKALAIGSLYAICTRIRKRLYKAHFLLPTYRIVERPSKAAALANARKREQCVRKVLRAETEIKQQHGLSALVEGASLRAMDRERRVTELEPLPVFQSPPAKGVPSVPAGNTVRRHRRKLLVKGLRRSLSISRSTVAFSSERGSTDTSLASMLDAERQPLMLNVWPELGTLGINGITFDFEKCTLPLPLHFLLTPQTLTTRPTPCACRPDA